MNDIVKTETYKGYKIEIWWDECADYRDSDHLGKFYSNLRDLNPDKKEIDEAFENGIFDKEGRIRDELIYVNVYAYIHSGIALSTSRRGQFADTWDSGWAGVMACTIDEARKWLGDNCTIEEIEKHLESEVEELDHFCQGEVYGFTLYDEDGTEEDSVGYYVGDIDYCLECAKGMVDAYEKYEYERQFNESMNYAEAE